jgi:hypothetical protein
MKKTAAARLQFVDKVARQLAREHTKCAAKKKVFIKKATAPQIALSSPEARAKAKVVQKALKVLRGAPPNVISGALNLTAKELRSCCI